MTAQQTPCPGVKGHGFQNVPGAWYDVGAHVDAAYAVIASAADYMDSIKGAPSDNTGHVASLISGATELLKLARQDVDELERQLKSA